jgi:hypothetical protein
VTEAPAFGRRFCRVRSDVRWHNREVVPDAAVVPSGITSSASGPPVPGGRILFIDLARAIAVLLMVQGHTIDALLHTDFRTSLQ